MDAAGVIVVYEKRGYKEGVLGFEIEGIADGGGEFLFGFYKKKQVVLGGP